MPDFNYWKNLHDSEKLEEFNFNDEGILWLKVKSIIRKDLISEFCLANKITLKENSLRGQFFELFSILVKNTKNAHNILDDYIKSKNKSQLQALDTIKLVSELYKLKSFDWGGDYQNSLDKFLVSRYVKTLQSYDTLISKFETEMSLAVQGYVLNSWYNHWSSILIEHIFKSHQAVLPTVGQIKHVDFFIGNIPFDLKVTYLPSEYIKVKRKALGLPVELTFLKAAARELNICYDKKAKPNDIYYEITEKLKDKNTDQSRKVLNELSDQKMRILEDALNNPKALAKWLYENQGEMRFGSENRLFLVLVDTKDFLSSWKLKRNMDLLKPVIEKYLDDYYKKTTSELKIEFMYKGKPQAFTALTDVIFVIN